MAKDPSRQQPEEEEFILLLCPKCGGIVGELASGQVRLLCTKCRVKTIFTRWKSDKIPEHVIYLVVSPGDGYTPGAV
ncbi:MAG TPA: hypothetical protein VFV58_03805 [Blastocatellia bacterium]|jgi:ribosomal protein S27AE|nr:hypothetical protein [Blastocatellia bacterium]